MVRIKHAVSSKKHKKRYLKRAKGQFGHKSRRYRQARRSLIKGMVYAYGDRKTKKRAYRGLWIARINAACKEAGMTYSRFIKGLTVANVDIDRKVLADLAVTSPEAFRQLVKVAQEQPAAAPAAKATKAAKA